MFLQALMCCAIFGSVSFASCSCTPKVPPLRDLYEVVQNFPTVNFCNRTFESNWWLNPGNVRMVTFNGRLNKRETARELCNCFHKLINQKDWLVGAGKKCYYHHCNNTVTLEFTGLPDPTYNPCAKPTVDRPLNKMKLIAAQFKDNTQMFGVQCQSKWIEDKCGCLHVMIECPIDRKTDAQNFCCRIIDYFNQKTGNGKGLLQDSVTHCNTCGSTLEVEFIGNTKEGVDCEAPRYYQYTTFTPSLAVYKN